MGDNSERQAFHNPFHQDALMAETVCQDIVKLEWAVAGYCQALAIERPWW
jgi:hypothetical protein